MKLLTLLIFISVIAWTSCRKDKIKLKDIQVLTLHQGQWTTGKRTRPIPQLKCIGGSAGCRAYQPSTVQCYNKGFDGVSTQWQCKAEMDNKYKFGTVEVICEGYDYADDPYVLVGSCGLEYTLDLIKSDGSYSYGKYSQPEKTVRSSEGFSLVYPILIIGAIVLIYYTCLSTPQRRHTSPPPPGFRSEFYQQPSDSGHFGQSCDDSYRRSSANENNGNRFWTGLMTGGALGYLFGNRNTQPSPAYFSNTSTRASSSRDNDEASSRTTSGFGGTRRR